ncbi:LysR family transcriptional regulator [Neisseria sp.]|uniref:LysR family transcriptional regulator n=1 Tax=Neisseria sp. TaxID=192066 RepID=UPI0026DAD73A|nr:LysR family transcriptional regulator [Neisseria sp.]MDO4907993.1 LysR family transcriptional regulator [Neisseria sp.]
MITPSLYGYLTVFHTIVEQGNISKASRSLQVSVPSVSNTLKALEKELGLTLFHRSTRNLTLTEAGQRLYDDTKPLIKALQNSIENIRDLRQTPSGLVRTTLPRFAYHLLVKPFYAEFCRRYPDVLLEISVFDGTVDIVREGFDVGIRFGDKIEDGVVAKPLLPPMKDCLTVSKNYADKYGIPHTPQDLPRHKLIGYRFITANRLLPLELAAGGQKTAIEMPMSLIVNDETDLMTDAVRQGLGIGRIFESTLALQPDKDEFIPVLQDYWAEYPPVYLYFLQNSQKIGRVKVWMDFLQEKAKLFWPET